MTNGKYFYNKKDKDISYKITQGRLIWIKLPILSKHIPSEFFKITFYFFNLKLGDDLNVQWSAKIINNRIFFKIPTNYKYCYSSDVG